MPLVDYSLYLVTDSTMVPESSTFLTQVEKSVKAGATLIQLREKSLSTLDFINRAKAVQKITKALGVPLIINDRIDVALAIDADGVHVGQDDMPAEVARKLLGANKILGVTCSSPQEVQTVCDEQVADYVGIGTVYKTQTKTDTKTPLGTGPIGIRKMLRVLKRYNDDKSKQAIKCVAIGGVNEKNAAKVLYQCQVEDQKLDGLAVVSCIMANEHADVATKELQLQITLQVPWKQDVSSDISKSYEYSGCKATQLNTLQKAGALVHHITNNVVKNFSANVTLAIGASPIMSELLEEYEEFASQIPNIALVLNVGTPTADMMKVFIHAIQTYNKYGKHIVYDPVAVGATSTRLECSRQLLNAGQMSVIKGNVGELLAIWKLSSLYQDLNTQEVLMRGVDSIAELAEEQIIQMGIEVSKDFKCIVVISGPVNYIIAADSYPQGKTHVVKVNGGSKLMGAITGSGCSLGSTIAAFIAAKADSQPPTQTISTNTHTNIAEFRIFEAVVAAVNLYNEAGAMAAQSCSTPGSFVPKFLDCLYSMLHC